MDLLWRSSEDPPVSLGSPIASQGHSTPLQRDQRTPAECWNLMGQRRKRRRRGSGGAGPPVSTGKNRGGRAEALLRTIREQEFNLHALNELLEVLISLPRALREGD